MLKFPPRNALRSEEPWMRTVEENVSEVDTSIRVLDKQISNTERASSAGLLAFQRQVADFDYYLQNVVRTEVKTLRIVDSMIPTTPDTENTYFISFPFVNLSQIDVRVSGTYYEEYATSSDWDVEIDLIPWDSSPVDPLWIWWNLPYAPVDNSWDPKYSSTGSAYSKTWDQALRITLDHMLEDPGSGVPIYNSVDHTVSFRDPVKPYRAVVAVRITSGPAIADRDTTHLDARLSFMATSYPDFFRGVN